MHDQISSVRDSVLETAPSAACLRTMSTMRSNSSSNALPKFSDIMQDLAIRFIINCPDEELETFERMFFQIEAAYWYYEDFYRETYPSLPAYKHLRDFSAALFSECTFLQPYKQKVPELFEKFNEYKSRVPTCGAIILSPKLDKVLLVKGYYKRASWGFPKGKINKDESEVNCAIREVYEETSLDIAPYVDENDYLVAQIGKHRNVLFIVVGIPEDAHKAPQTRKEISEIEFIPLSDLPTDSSPSTVRNKYFMVLPFLHRLRRWIQTRKKSKSSKAAASRASSTASHSSSARSSTTGRNQSAATTSTGSNSNTGNSNSSNTSSTVTVPSATPSVNSKNTGSSSKLSSTVAGSGTVQPYSVALTATTASTISPPFIASTVPPAPWIDSNKNTPLFLSAFSTSTSTNNTNPVATSPLLFQLDRDALIRAYDTGLQYSS